MLPEASSDLKVLVKALGTIQCRIGVKGRLHLGMELLESLEEDHRTYFYGHSDIVALFSHTIKIQNWRQNEYAEPLSRVLQVSCSGQVIIAQLIGTPHPLHNPDLLLKISNFQLAPNIMHLDRSSSYAVQISLAYIR